MVSRAHLKRQDVLLVALVERQRLVLAAHAPKVTG